MIALILYTEPEELQELSAGLAEVRSSNCQRPENSLARFDGFRSFSEIALVLRLRELIVQLA